MKFNANDAKVISYVKCVVCDSYYHISCAKQIKSEFLDESFIKCCDTLFEKEGLSDYSDNKFFDAMDNLASDLVGRIDINIFQYLLKHKDFKELLLSCEKIQLLNEKLSVLDKNNPSDKQ